jgi:hypothetical protein
MITHKGQYEDDRTTPEVGRGPVETLFDRDPVKAARIRSWLYEEGIGGKAGSGKDLGDREFAALSGDKQRFNLPQ